MGRFEPVIRRLDPDDNRLSFNNLIEIHVIRALRDVHDVKLDRIRQAVQAAERELDIPRLLISPRLRTADQELFLDELTHLVQLTPAAQLAMRSILAQYLKRIEYDASTLPSEFFPHERIYPGTRLVSVSPFVAFGQAVVGRVGVSTFAIARRVNAGEDEATVRDDYGLTDQEFEEAIGYETAA